MKHSSNIFTIDKDYAANLQNKLDAYQELSKDKRTLHLVMVTTNGVAHNSNFNMIQKRGYHGRPVCHINMIWPGA